MHPLPLSIPQSADAINMANAVSSSLKIARLTAVFLQPEHLCRVKSFPCYHHRADCIFLVYNNTPNPLLEI